MAKALTTSTLRGLQVPGAQERLVAKLFADDTTVFLGEDDDYAEVDRVTGTWCRGSRAKFNLHKTEIIPLGTPEYRAQLVATRALCPGGETVHPDAHIARDGEAVRLLGAWIGNEVDPSQSWRPVVETVKRNLNKWAARRPTLHGKKLIVGMEIGARTQFRAKAQGMPQSVEKELTAAMRAFIWGEGKAPKVAMATLQGSYDDGGIALLDLEARNVAIDLVWLRDYLRLTERRPAWATLADVLLADAVSADTRGTPPAARLNTFLQTWKVSLRASAGLPLYLRRMVKFAAQYRVALDVAKPSSDVCAAMPICALGSDTVSGPWGSVPVWRRG
ncbi:hypothetical protein C8Q73DRAFT_744726 [Cubamyces lactineus]|nr:hypothetical protein C8Q73DRAFT_746514 [Cubamyces lactineus]KAH9896825.1 hypothetical protein C8Q73DRAFT_744726 [Cubamyces lactineus]